MQVTIIRHGQSEGNLGRYYPNHQTPLTDIGHQQAKKVMEHLSNHDFDSLFTSPIHRAIQTASYLSEHFNLPMTQVPLLTELKDPTEFEGKKFDDEAVQKIKLILKANLEDPDFHYSDEENYTDFINRGKKTLDFFTKLPYEKILVVSHRFMISMLTLLVVLDTHLSPVILYDGMRKVHPFNTAVSVFEYTDGIWGLYSFGDRMHLD